MKTFGETLNIAPIDAKMMSQPADTERRTYRTVQTYDVLVKI